MSALGPVGKEIARKLRVAFSPDLLVVTDDSHRHAGHVGAHPRGESHFGVRIVAEAFDGEPRIVRHRMVHRALSDELDQRVHALAIRAEALGESFDLVELAPDDLRLAALLRATGLPADDLKAARFIGFAAPEAALLAAGGLARHGPDGLMRSIAVSPDHRGRGLGHAIASRLMRLARGEAIPSLFLLTDSAQGFFATLGFEPVARAEVPAAVREASQFRNGVCAAAQAMRASLIG